MPEILLIIFVTFLVSCTSMVLLRRMARRTGLLMHKDVALVGGIGIALALSASLALGVWLFGHRVDKAAALFAISLMMLVFGVLDDLKEASVVKKLLGQSLCAIALIAFDIRTHIIFVDDFTNCLVTFLWVLGVTNAFNLLDTIDGLSAGVACIAAAALGWFSFLSMDVSTALLTSALAAAALGFGIFNFPPARIYLGNAGSHFLGFLLAALSLLVSFANTDHPMALISPIFILWIPLLETATVIGFRLSKGISPFNKSNDHMALRLELGGVTRKRALLILLTLQLFFAGCGIMLVTLETIYAKLICGIVLLVSVLLIKVLMRAGCNGR